MQEPAQIGPVREGDIVAGKYRVERVIGVGGMGVVVAATHIQLEQRVALKFVLPDVLANDLSRERFIREARASVRLKSEHVARVLDVGTLETGEPFTVMEYLEGCDLSTITKQQKPLRIADAAEYVLQACEAIVEAHSLGIVHRDLKPQNLFITRRVNGAPLVKVLDFGISKATGPGSAGAQSLTNSSTVLGSPLYMAPEQMRSARNVDVRGDVWSLGVILYELLTGRVPFNGETMTELCLKVVSEPLPPPKEIRADLPDGLVKIVTRCLEKDPDLRFPHVAMLAEALEPFSASAERGTTDRGWRSLVDTADQLDVPSVLRQAEASSGPSQPLPQSGTQATFGGTRSSGSPAERRKQTFWRGALVGAVLPAVIGAALILSTKRAEKVSVAPGSAAVSVEPGPLPAASASSPSPVTAPSAASASPPSTSLPKPSLPVAARPAASARVRPPPAPSASSAPVASVSAAPSARPPSNGAPILH